MSSKDSATKPADHLSPKEVEDVESLSRLRVPAIYEVIRQEGEEELVRPAFSLWMSGLAAGIGISASVLMRGLLHQHLPDTHWALIIEAFGYTAGFLIVILGRMQLFTENTITAVLPVFSGPSWEKLVCICRLWSIVFIANIVGTFAAAWLATHSGIISGEQLAASLDISRHAVFLDGSILVRAIPAGFFIAALVWMMPSSKENSFWLIVAMTYIIALGEFPHVIAGSTEAFLLVLAGEMSIVAAMTDFIGPALVGNIIGGTGLFALLAYGQVKLEME